MTWEFYKTTNQIRDKIPCRPGNLLELWRVIYRMQIPLIKAGDLIEAKGYMSITNDTGVVASVVAKICFGDHMNTHPYTLKYGYKTDKITGTALGYGAGANTTPKMHHNKIMADESWTSDKDYDNLWITFCAKATSSAAKHNDIIKIGQNSAPFTVKILKSPATNTTSC